MIESTPPKDTGVPEKVDSVFRESARPLTSQLARRFSMPVAESVIQDAFLKALEVWPEQGIPQNPAAWIYTAARNRAIDLFRIGRRNRIRDREAQSEELEFRRSFEGIGRPESDFTSGESDAAKLDATLTAVFACCHPSLSQKSQVALALRVIGGFTNSELAALFFSSYETTRKLITRAKKRLRLVDPGELRPSSDEFPDRIPAVLETLYAMFALGFAPGDADDAVRMDVCDQAIRLTNTFLHEAFEEMACRPRVLALLALMLFQSSRIPARVDPDGELVPLEAQDRSLWDKSRIRYGLMLLDRSHSGDELSHFHVEAAIAACHATTASFEETDWSRIVHLYDILLEWGESRGVLVSRAFAVGMRDGAEEGLHALRPLLEDTGGGSHETLAAAAFFEERLGRFDEAARHLRLAVKAAPTSAERRFLERKWSEMSRNRHPQRRVRND